MLGRWNEARGAEFVWHGGEGVGAKNIISDSQAGMCDPAWSLFQEERGLTHHLSKGTARDFWKSLKAVIISYKEQITLLVSFVYYKSSSVGPKALVFCWKRQRPKWIFTVLERCQVSKTPNRFWSILSCELLNYCHVCYKWLLRKRPEAIWKKLRQERRCEMWRLIMTHHNESPFLM